MLAHNLKGTHHARHAVLIEREEAGMSAEIEAVAEELIKMAAGDVKLALRFACATLIEIVPSELAFKHLRARMAPSVAPAEERSHL